MDEFFRHENQGTSTSLSDMGDLRHGTKSKPMSCVESLIAVQQKDMPDLEAKIVDGSVVVNMLSPKASSTFSDYAADVFLPYQQKRTIFYMVKRQEICHLFIARNPFGRK